MRVLVAGAGGAIGRSLMSRLVAAGHAVVGLTHGAEKARQLTQPHCEVVAADGLDPVAVRRVVSAARPDVIVHQMTALAASTDLRQFDRAFAMTNRLRTAGLDNLLAAGRAGGVRRIVCQSYCGWPYARIGNEIRRRRFPVIADGNGWWSFVHIEDAAAATVLAIDRGRPGIYNIVDDEPAPVREWLPALASMLGAKPPFHVPKWIARILAGNHLVTMMTEARAGSNARAKLELGWRPIYASWRTGFAAR